MQKHTRFEKKEQRICGWTLVQIARKLSKLEPEVQLRNFPSVEQIQDRDFKNYKIAKISWYLDKILKTTIFLSITL